MSDGCALIDIGCHAAQGAKWVVGSFADSIIGQWAQSALEGFSDALVAVNAGWMSLPTPGLSSSSGEALIWAGAHTRYFTAALLTLGMMSAGISVAWTRRTDGLREALRAVLITLATSTVGVLLITTLVSIGDQTAAWLLDESTQGDGKYFGIRMAAMTGFNPIWILVLSLLGIIAQILMIAVMLIRSILLILLTAVLPVAAAASNMEWGRAWWRKHVGWLTAFVFYKPLAALIYAICVRFVATQQSSQWWTGTVGLVMATFMALICALALPALVGFLAPTSSGSGGGGGVGAMIAGGASMATGAVSIARTTSTSSGGGVGGGGASATGATPTPGMTGSTGMTGTTGSAGATGSAGSAGAAGAAGPVGVAVAAGAQAVGAVTNTLRQTVDESTQGPSGSDAVAPGGDVS